MRPFARGVYHPFAWRGWWDFGTGALGDMACHTVNLPFAALNLRDPISVMAKTSGSQQGNLSVVVDHRVRIPGQRQASAGEDDLVRWQAIAADFAFWTTRITPPASRWQGPEVEGRFRRGHAHRLPLRWRKGWLVRAGRLQRRHRSIGVEMPKNLQYKKSPGHFKEWVNAIKGGEPAMSNFPDYAGPLTETILLGNLAVWADGNESRVGCQEHGGHERSGAQEHCLPRIPSGLFPLTASG